MSATLATLERRAAAIARDLKMLAPREETPSPAQMAARLGLTLDSWQQSVLEATEREILMLCSRQSGKSTVAALMATHQAVYSPGSLVLILSPGERQSKLLLRKVYRFYGALRGTVPPDAESRLSLELANGSEIHALPGKEGTVRGFSDVDLLIEDEAAIVADDLYMAIRPMLAVSGGRIVLLSTPRGRRGHFYYEYAAGGESWHRASVTAEQCPRIDPMWLEAERAKIGDYWYRQEYGCQFVDTDDQLYATDLVEAAVSKDVAPLVLPMVSGSAA